MQTDVPLDNPIYAVVGQTFHIIMDIELWYNEHILTSYNIDIQQVTKTLFGLQNICF